MRSWADQARQADSFGWLGVDVAPVAAGTAPFPMWLVSLRQTPSAALLGLLSEGERARADRFRTQRLRNRYVAAHAAVRLLGERRHGIPAASQRFECNAFGKPHLAGVADAQCSISYSGDHALVALARGAEIGVDIEALRPIDDAAELMVIHYTAGEQAALRQMLEMGEALDRAFLTVWVRKEACVKALERGLDIPLTTVECGVGSGMTTVRFGDRDIHTGVIHAPCDHIIAWAQCCSVHIPDLQRFRKPC